MIHSQYRHIFKSDILEEELMTSNNRIGFIDNTRVLLTILVVLVHTSVTYGGEGGWYVSEETESMVSTILLTLFNAVNQSFFMSLFFLIGGYFTALSLKKKGSVEFAKGRILRLGLPLLMFFLAVGPLTVFLSDSLYYGEGFDFSKSMHVGPMWFAQALLIFSAIYLLIHRFIPAGSSRSRISLPLLIAILSSTTFAARAIWPMGEGIWGMQLGSFPQYIVMYIIGIKAGKTDWQTYLSKVKTSRLIILVFFLVLLMPVFMFLGEDPQLGLNVFMGGVYWQAGFFALWESAMCVLMSLMILAMTYQKKSDQNSLLKKMSRSSYGVYIIHPPVLVLTSVMLMGISVHPMLKFLMAGSIAISVSYLLSEMLVRTPGLRRVI